MDRRPIGVFDSGLGGLTAVKEMLAVLPDEDILYLGDTARVPYGSRRQETIVRYARQDLAFLSRHDPKAILVACGTVSATALPHLRESTGIPMVGVIEGAAEKAAAVTKNKKIAVLATSASVKSGAYSRAVAALDPEIRVLEKACPLFVPLVENGHVDPEDPVTELVAQEYLSQVIPFGADTVILGCTHYPLIRKIIGRLLPGCTLVEAGKEAVLKLREILRREDLEAEKGHGGSLRCCVTESPDSFNRIGELFLGQEISGVTTCVSLDGE